MKSIQTRMLIECAGKRHRSGLPKRKEWGRGTVSFICYLLFAICHFVPILSLAAALALLPGCREKVSNASGKRVVVLGFDGMDPRLVRRLMDEGKMPNFSKLAAEGGFWELGTSVPPQSPVAWSNFIVGGDPGAHGVFDFIHRRFENNELVPFFSTNETKKGDPPKEIWGYYVPLPWQESSEILLKRGGTPFWDYLDEKNIPARLYRIPANYPPSASKHANVKALSGMGTTDLLGTQGTFQWFSAEFDENTQMLGGEGMGRPLEYDSENGRWTCKIEGIPNPMVKTEKPMELLVSIEPDRAGNTARISYVNRGCAASQNETVEFLLDSDEWSDWKPIVFLPSQLDISNGGGSRGMVRFWLRQAGPTPELYVTPINFDPLYPSGKITEPDAWAKELGKALGRFYTSGFAEDFHAREAKVKVGFDEDSYELRLFGDEEYRKQSQFVLDGWKVLLDYALKEYKDGFLFFYFSSSDQIGHMFYWEPEPGQPELFTGHPVRDDPAEAEKYTKVLRDVYAQCDEQLGKVRKALGDDITLFVMSDHGFMRYRRKLNLNNWLLDHGFIALKDEDVRRGSLNNIADWSKTKAYSIGLNAIYLNLKGREPFGSVDPADKDKVIQEVNDALLATRDPVDNRPVVKIVYRTDQVYHGDYAPGGPHDQSTPDLIVGLHREYVVRLGGQGDLTSKWISNNTGEWSADHCVAAELVPGILFSNRKINLADPNLTDLAPTILAEFGLPKGEKMTGRNLFAAEPAQKSAAK